MRETAKVSALKKFMDARGLKPHPWAKAAGLRSSTLYNFLSGTSQSLSTETLEKLAAAAGVTVDELLGNQPLRRPSEANSKTVPLLWTVGIYGRLFEMEPKTNIARPVGIPTDAKVIAARIDGDGLHPVPPGWTVFFTEAPAAAESLVGKVAVVKIVGSTQMMVREIRRGTQAGLYTLLSWSASPIENVEISAAHPILAITQPV
jgi:transcriptional regulator with XRE-family HTH domain